VAESFPAEIAHRHRFTWKGEVEQLHRALVAQGPAVFQRSLAAAGERQLYAAQHVIALLAADSTRRHRQRGVVLDDEVADYIVAALLLSQEVLDLGPIEPDHRVAINLEYRRGHVPKLAQFLQSCLIGTHIAILELHTS